MKACIEPVMVDIMYSMTRIINSNDKFNSLSFIKYSSTRTKENRVLGLFVCDCGSKIEASVGRVASGYKKNCGDNLHRPKPNLTHGKRYTAEYRVWQGIKNRMLNTNSKDYSRYGEKLEMSGSLANDFMRFYKEVGERPSEKHQIDRIDNTRGYVEGNLRWSTPKENGRNKSNNVAVVVSGKTYATLAEAAESHGVTPTTVTKWCKGYYDKRRSTYTPPKKGCYYVRGS